MPNRNNNLFTARFGGTCNQCGHWFSRGTRIVRVGSQVYAHLNCNPRVNQVPRGGRGPAPNLSGSWRNQTAGGWSSN